MPSPAYGHDGVPPIVLKNCASVLTTSLVKVFRLSLHLPFFPALRMPTCNLFLRKVTTLTLQATFLQLYFLTILMLLRLSLTGKIISIFQLQNFFLISSMDSVWVALLLIFLPFCLILGHPLLVVSVKLLLLP